MGAAALGNDETIVDILMASLVFCLACLYFGYRKKIIRNPGDWSQIDGRKSPWNYRVALFLWATFCALLFVCVVLEIKRYVL